MNKQMIIGTLTRDPETGTTPAGVNYCRFTLAVRKRKPKEGEPDADFIRVTAWRGLGDSCARYLRKGKRAAVLGTPSNSQWTGRDGVARCQTEIDADEVEFLTPRSEDSAANDAGDTTPPPTPAPPMTPADDEDRPW